MKNTVFNPKLLFVLMLTILYGLLFFRAYLNFHFNQDMVWRIDEQRREHLNLYFQESRIIHNKLVSFLYLVINIYLMSLSPITLFSQTPIFIVNLIIFGFFIFGVVRFLRSNIQMKKIFIIWVFLYPALLGLNTRLPNEILILPITLPFLTISLVNSLKFIRKLI